MYIIVIIYCRSYLLQAPRTVPLINDDRIRTANTNVILIILNDNNWIAVSGRTAALKKKLTHKNFIAAQNEWYNRGFVYANVASGWQCKYTHNEHTIEFTQVVNLFLIINWWLFSRVSTPIGAAVAVAALSSRALSSSFVLVSFRRWIQQRAATQPTTTLTCVDWRTVNLLLLFERKQ